MRRLTLVLTLGLLASPLAAQDDAAIRDVIGNQLQAFTDRDVAEAWTYASPMIQRLFGTAENFGAMVRNGYPMVWDNSDAEFLDLDGDGATRTQEVYVRDGEGRGWILDYSMIATDQGWRINGVTVIPAPDLAA